MIDFASAARVRPRVPWKLVSATILLAGGLALGLLGLVRWQLGAERSGSAAGSARTASQTPRRAAATARAGEEAREVTASDGALSGAPASVAAGLRSRRFAELDALLTAIVSAERDDPGRGEPPAGLAFEPFASADPALAEVAEGWLRASPNSAFAHLLLASHRNALAWEARGKRYASETPRSGFEDFARLRAEALPEARAAVRLEPDLVEGWVLLINLALGEPRECIRAADEGLTRLRHSFRIRVALMNCFRPRWGGNYRAMDALAEEAGRYAPENPNLAALRGYSAYDRANLASGNDDLEAAERWIDQAIEQGGRHWKFLDQKAWILRKQRQNGAALELMGEALEKMPGLPELLFDRLGLLVAVGRTQEAYLDLERIAAVDPFRSGLEDWRVRLVKEEREACEELVRSSQLDEAILRCAAVAEALPDDAEAHYWLGRARIQRGRYAASVADFERAVDLDPRYRDAIVNLDWLYSRQNDWAKILAHWNRYLELEPNDAKALVERAGTHRHLGDEGAACRDVARACELGSAKACTFASRDCRDGAARE